MYQSRSKNELVKFGGFHMAYRFKSTPLAKMRLTQPFSVDYIGNGFYKKLGLNGHDGWDLSALTGTEVFAVADGTVESFSDGGYGINARLFTFVDGNTKLEIVYGHLKEVIKTGDVSAGDVVALSNNTGLSTAPHLHFGVRPWIRRGGVGDVWDVKDYNNGYFGYVDPLQFYPLTVFDLPVDKRYGIKDAPSEAAFYPSQLWFFFKFKRLMTTREYNATRFGRWDIRTVLDPAMAEVWWNYSKPEAISKKII